MKSYGHCARLDCQTVNVLGIARREERSTIAILEEQGLQLQTACSGGCHELLESDVNEVHKNLLPGLRRQSVQSPCQTCHKMVSTGSQNSHNGKFIRALQPLQSRGTFCGPCRKYEGG